MAKKKKKKSAPAEPAPLNVGQITQQGQQAAQVNLDQLRDYYRRLASDIGNNTYAQGAWAQAEKGALRSNEIAGMAADTRAYQAQRADDLYGLAGQTRQQAIDASERVNVIGSDLQRLAGQIQTGPTALERQIRSAGMGALNAQADQVSAARMRAGQVASGAIGDALMGQALERAQSTGRLSAEASRDAVQSARAGMAARGMATGSAGLAAELLNRDRYARGRQAEDLAFAQGVQQQDVARQFQNVANRMTASQANAQMRQQAALANQAANMQQLDANRAFMLNANQGAEATLAARRGLAGNVLGSSADAFSTGGQLMLGGNTASGDMLGRSAGTRLAGDTAGAGMLESSGNMALNTASNITQQNPYVLALGGLGSGAGMIQTGSNLAANTASFNTNMQASMYNSYLNNQAAMNAARMQSSALNNQGMMGMLGSALQGGIQAGGMIGAAQMAPMMFSDKRMKKDIKPIGKAGSVLGLTAYEFRYKDGGTKHVGFMAQDVKKVLPEAVAEVDYKGKKRLAIRPGVIGAALAQELTQAAA